MSDLTAEDIIAQLDLAPHPEGGYFRETFRDGVAHGGRGHSTAIYFLLRAGEVSRWHKVDAAEVWHWHAGSPLRLSIVDDQQSVTGLMLGVDLMSGQRPQAVVPAGHWQQARSDGAWSLVGCTVAPGFTFAGFVIGDAAFDPTVARTEASELG